MSTINYIEINQLCNHYELEVTFFQKLNEYGLIELEVVGELTCIDEEQLENLEKMLRLHRDLEINIEGIDTILHLLKRIDTLQNELLVTKSRLRLFEEE